MSGTPGEEVIDNLLDLGVVDFISKPVNINELVVKCRRFIKRQKNGDGQTSYHLNISTEPSQRQIFIDGEFVEELTGKQYQIFVAILRTGPDGISKRISITQYGLARQSILEPFQFTWQGSGRNLRTPVSKLPLTKKTKFTVLRPIKNKVPVIRMPPSKL